MLQVMHPYRPGQVGTVIRWIGHDVLVKWPSGFTEWIEQHWLRAVQ
jgi:hypothetical protein